MSYNRPKFCPNATWNTSATIFAASGIVGNSPYPVFVDTNNTLYTANRQYDSILIWREGQSVERKNISSVSSDPVAIFVSDSGDIYVDSMNPTTGVDKWSVNAQAPVKVMYTCGQCYGLFVDVIDNIYCSAKQKQKVVSKSLDNRLNVWKVVAGTDNTGSSSMELNWPSGIFVDTELNLYVADYGNHRVQKFRFGQIIGTTVVGTGAPGTISLTFPSAVVLDVDGYLFVSDSSGDRIVGSDAYGFRCILGCYGLGTQLNGPQGLSFDTYGNLYVADATNDRILKFLSIKQTCGKQQLIFKAKLQSHFLILGNSMTSTMNTGITNSFSKIIFKCKICLF